MTKKKPTDKMDAIVKTRTKTIKESDLQALLGDLTDETQDEIRNSVMEKASDKRLSGNWEELSTITTIEMLERLRNAVYKKIEDGDSYGGKSGDALNKWFLKICDSLEKYKKDLLPKTRITEVKLNADEETSREILISSGRIKGVKVIDAEFEEVKE